MIYLKDRPHQGLGHGTAHQGLLGGVCRLQCACSPAAPASRRLAGPGPVPPTGPGPSRRGGPAGLRARRAAPARRRHPVEPAPSRSAGRVRRANLRHSRPSTGADPLFRNAYALMVNTGTTGLLGLAYWLLAARHYAVGRRRPGSASTRR